jgi:hypothetical protein
MGSQYGIVLAGVVPFVILVLSCVIFIKRNHPFIKSRKPDFILVQNVGVAINFTLISLCILLVFFIRYIFLLQRDIGLRPHFLCQLNMITVVLNVSVVGWVLLVRIWEYCMHYHIAVLKVPPLYPLSLYPFSTNHRRSGTDSQNKVKPFSYPSFRSHFPSVYHN